MEAQCVPKHRPTASVLISVVVELALVSTPPRFFMAKIFTNYTKTITMSDSVLIVIPMVCDRLRPNFLTQNLQSANPPATLTTRLSSLDLATHSTEVADSPIPEREAVRILVIGSRQGVTSIIQTLFRVGFAEVHEWSPLLPGPNPGEVMSILTRYLLTH